MRQVVGKATVDLDAAAFAALRAPLPGSSLDIGTGDGKHVLAEARAPARHAGRRPGRRPGRDAPHGARAAAKPARGGAPNALFVWAAVERLPAELERRRPRCTA